MSYRFFRNVAFAFVSLVVFCEATSVYAHSSNDLHERIQRDGYSLHERVTALVSAPTSESTDVVVVQTPIDEPTPLLSTEPIGAVEPITSTPETSVDTLAPTAPTTADTTPTDPIVEPSVPAEPIVEPTVASVAEPAPEQVSTLALVPESPTGNMVYNPSLEEIGGDGMPAQWKGSSWGTNKPVFTYLSAGYEGSKAVQVQLTSYTSGDAKWMFEYVTVTPGATYHYSEYYKADVVTNVSIEYRHADGSYSWGWLGNPEATSAWTLFERSFVVPQTLSGKSPIVSVSVFHAILVVGTLAVDAVSLAKETVVPPDPSKAMVSVTFDDAWRTQYTNALPLLDKYSIKGTFYITTQYFDTTKYSGFMTKANVKDLYTRGHEIGGHTVTHKDLTTLSATKLKNEVVNSKTVLETVIGTKVRSIAYPYGSYNTKVINAVKVAGYQTGRTVIAGTNTGATPAYELRAISPKDTTSLEEIYRAIDDAKDNGTWLVIALHEIDSTGREYMHTPAYLEAVLQYIKNSGIKTTTVSEGFALR